MANKKTKICQICDKPFVARRDAKTCSPACRKRLQRWMQTAQQTAKAVAKEVVGEAVQLESELSQELHQLPVLADQRGAIEVAEPPTQTSPPAPAPITPPAPPVAPVSPIRPTESQPEVIPVRREEPVSAPAPQPPVTETPVAAPVMSEPPVQPEPAPEPAPQPLTGSESSAAESLEAEHPLTMELTNNRGEKEMIIDGRPSTYNDRAANAGLSPQERSGFEKLQGSKWSPFHFNRLAMMVTGSALLLILGVGLLGLGFLANQNSKRNPNPAQRIASFANTTLAVSNSQSPEQLQLERASSLLINGELKVANTVVLMPTARPSTPVEGQIYYDQTDKVPYFYNGSQFVSLAGVTSLGNAQGDITLGAGLSVVNNQLDVAGSFVQQINSSIAAAANSGVLSLAGTTNQINVSSSTGNVTLSLPQDIATTSSPTFQGLTLGGLGAGLVQSSVGGALSSGVVDRNNATYLSGLLTVPNGGTGAGSFTANGILYGNGSGALQVTNSLANATLITGVGGVPSLSQTLPLAVQDNITHTGVLDSGSITNGFGAISTVNNITTSAKVQAGQLEVDGGSFTVDNSGNFISASTGTIQGAGGLTIGVAGTTAGSLILANGSNAHLTTLQALSPAGFNQTITIPASTAATDTFCLLTLGNCTGAGGSVTASGGIQNYITKFTNAAGNQLGNSLLFDNGTSVGVNTALPNASYLLDVNGNLHVSGTSTLDNTLSVTAGGASILGTTNINTSGAAVTTIGNATGTVSLSGATSVTGTNTFSVGTGTTTLGGALNVTTGLATLSGGLSVSNGATITGLTNINNSGTANTSIGNATGTLGLASSTFNLSTGGAITGVTGYTQASGNFSQNGTGTFGTGTGNVSLNGATTVASTLTVQGAGGLTVGVAGTTAGAINLANGTNTNLSIISPTAPTGVGNATYSLPAIAGGGSDSFCLLTLGNCSGATGAAGGDLTGNYPNPTIAKLQGTTLTLSSLTSGDVLQYNGSAIVNGHVTNANLTAGTFSNITGTGALNAGSITNGFGTISTGNNITTTATVQGGIVNATSALELNGTDINSAGTLTNVAYKNQANIFTASQTVSGGFLYVDNNTTTNPTLSRGLAISNNRTAGGGEVDFFSNKATGSTGGYRFYDWNGTTATNLFTIDGSGNTTAAGTVNGATISGGTLSGGSLSATAVNGLQVASGTITSPTITGTITGSSSPTVTGFGTYNGQTISSTANFTGTLAVQGAGGVTIGTAGSVAGAINLANGTNTNLSVIQSSAPSGAGNATFTLPVIAGGSSDTFCLQTLANCAGAVGAAGGDLTGTYPNPTIAKLQGNTLTITAPASGEVLQYNGTAFVNGLITNSNLQAGTFSNITGTGALTAGSIASGFGTISTGNNITTTATVQSGVVNATSTLELGGTSINTAGTLSNVAYLNAANQSFTGINTFSRNGSGTGDYTLGVTGTPVADATSSLIRIGNAIASGNTNANGGTYIGLNEPASGAGSAADFINFQTNGSSKFKVDTFGDVNAAGNFQLTNSAVTGGALTKQFTAGTGGVTNNDVVIFANDGGNPRVIDSTTARDTRVIGVAGQTAGAGSGVAVKIAGSSQVTADTGAVALGDQLVVSSTSGEVTVDNNATTGILGYAASTKAGGSSGLVSVYIHPVNGQTNPTIPGNLTVSGTVTSGLINGQTISSSANFTGTLTVQGSSLTVGTPGSTAGSINLANGTSTREVVLQGLNPSGSGNATIQFPTIAGGSTDTVCLVTLGNCAGSGGGITGSGTSGTLAVFTGTGTIGNSVITESGSAVSVAGTLTATGASSLTLGTAGPAGNTGAIIFKNSTNANTLTLQSGATGSNLTFTLPTADGSNGNCLQTNGSGTLSFGACTGGAGGGVTSLDGLTGVLTLANSSGVGTTVTINNAKADASTKGIATFNSTDFSDNGSGTIDTIQPINSTATPTFGALTLGAAGSSAGSLKLANATNTNLSIINATAPTGVGNATYSLPAIAGGGSDTFCLLSAANCSATGTAGGDLTGSYPNPTIAKLQGTTLTLSSLTSGDVLQYNGSAIVNGHITNANLTAGTFSAITGTGALTAGSIASGFGTISTGNNITTTATVQGGIVSATSTLELNGTDINTAGTLSNVAYLNAATQSFTGKNTFSRNGSGTGDYTLGITGTPVADATSSLVSIGGAISGGNNSANGGTYIGINEPNSGAGNTADFVNFENNGTSKFKVDSSGDIFGAGNLNITNSALSAGTISKAFTAGTGGVSANDVVIFANDGGNLRVIDTTTARDIRVIGVAQSTKTSGSVVQVAVAGNVQVTADTGAVALGDQLVTSSTSGEVTVDNNATTGILGYAMSTKAGGSSGLVNVYIHPVNGQTNPTIPGNLTVQGTGTSSFGGTLNAATAYQLNGTQIVDSSRNLVNIGTITSGNINSQTISSAANFTGTLTVQGSGGLTLGVASSATGLLTFANSGSGFTTSIQSAAQANNVALTIPADTHTTDTICLATLSNCTAAGAASGDLTGTYPGPTIAKLQGTTLTLSSLVSGDVLQYNGSAIVNGHITNANLTAGTFSAITGTGALTAGSIASGFGTISTGNNITTTATVQGGIVNGTSALELNGTDINSAGTLTNVAYLNQSNGFTNVNTFSRNGAGTGDYTLGVTGTPVADATSSLIRIGNAISGGNTSTNGGTWLGIDAPSSGAGTAADFVNFQNGGSLRFKVDSSGIVSTNQNFQLTNSSLTTGNITKAFTVGTGGVTANDVVVLANDGGNTRVIDSTTARDPRVIGVANTTVTSGSTTQIKLLGNFQVTADTGAVAIGDQLVVSSTSGQVTVDNNATTGILGYALSTKAGGSSGLVSVYVHPVNGVTNPTIPGNLTVQGVGTSSFGGNLTVTGTINTATISGGSLSGTAVNGLSVSGGTITNPTISGTVTGSGSPTITGFGTISAGTYNGQTISSAASFTGTVAIQGANALTLGVTGTSTGAILFKGATAASGTLTLIGPANPGTNTLTLPNETGTLCSTGSICSGYAPSTGGNYIAKNAADTSSSSVAGNLLGLTNTNTGAGGVLALTNNGTNSALNVLQSGTSEPSAGQALILANNNTTTPSGNLLDLQNKSTSELHVDVSGNLVTIGNITGVNLTTSGTVTFNSTPASGGTTLLCLDGSSILKVCSGTAGTGNFILNGTSLQTSANFAIQSTGTTNVTALIKQNTSQTADLLQFQNSSGNAITGFDASGKLQFADGAGGAYDTNLYRSAANTLKTDDALTVAGLLTGQLGATVSGATISLNASSNFGTNINTGSSTGAVAIGNSAAGNIGLTTSSANAINLTANDVNLQQAANLTAGQTQLAQTLTNGSSSGGTVTGYSQTLTVNNSSSASTSNAISLTVTDNTASSLLNTNTGLNITMNGTNNSQVQQGIVVSTARGWAIQATASGAAGNNLSCGNITTNSPIAVCGQATSGGTGVYAYGTSTTGSTLPSATRSGAFGLYKLTGTPTDTAQGVYGSFISTATTAYSGAGVYGDSQGAGSASVYGGYFTLSSSNTATAGAALYATTPSYGNASSGNGINAVNVLQAAGGAGQTATAITGVTAGSGAAISLATGAGGAVTGASGANIGGAGGAFAVQGGNGGAATSGTGGNGAGITLTAGNGGNGSTAGGSGGKITLIAGSAGTGGTGTAGSVIVQNAADSTNAFQVQNHAGTSNLLVADTSNTRIGLGVAPVTTAGSGLLQVGSSGTTPSAAGISFGGDTVANLYRSAAGTLTTDGTLTLDGSTSAVKVNNLSSSSTLAYSANVAGDTNPRIYIQGSGQINWGSGSGATDTTLRRTGSATLATDGWFEALGGSFLTDTGYFQQSSASATTDILLDSKLSGDTVSRFRATADGTLNWGPGGASARDTSLSRSGVAELTANGNLVLQGGSLLTNQTTANLFNTTATTLNIGGNVGAGGIVLAGGSGSTGCTLDGSTGNFTCSGNITGGATGTVGYWTRSGTTLSPSNANDNISVGSSTASASVIKAADGTLLSLIPGAGTATDSGSISIGNNRAFFGYDGSTSNAQVQGASGKGIELQVNGGTTALGFTSGGEADFTSPADGVYFQTGSTGTRSSIQIGRTSGEALLGVSSSAGQYSTDVNAAGDVVLRSNTGATRLILQNGTGAGNIILDTGNTTIKPTTDSTNAFQIQNAAGTSILLTADTINNHATIGNSTVTTPVQEWDSHGTNQATVSVAPHTIGNLMTLAIKIPSSSMSVSSVSGGGVTNWTRVNTIGTGSIMIELWEGTVTSTGASTITLTYSGTPGGNCEIVSQEFTAGLGSNTNWSVTSSNTIANGSSTTLTYPTLTATQAGELYWGYVYASQTGSAGSSPGFSYVTTGNQNIVAYDTNTVAGTAYAPTASQAPAGTSEGIAMLIAASVGTTLNVNGTANVTGSNSTTAFQVQNAAGTSLLAADTSNTKLNIVGDLNVGTRFGNRLFSDNFESGGFKLWDQGTAGSISADTATVHDGKYSAKINPAATQATATATIAANSTVYMRAWVNVSSQTSSAADLLRLGDSTFTNYWTVFRNSSGTISLFNGVPAVNASVTGSGIISLPTGSWHLIEMRITTGAGTGTSQVWLDGSLVISQVGNQNNGTNNIAGAQIGDSQGSRTFTANIDDLSVDTAPNGTASSLGVDDSLHVGGTASFGGNVLIQGTTNNANAFQVLDSSGGVALQVNSNTGGVGIGLAATTTDKLFIQSTGLDLITANATGTGASNDLMHLEHGGVDVVTVDNTGKTTFKNSTDSTTALQVQDTGAGTVFDVNTTNGTVGIGTAGLTDAKLYITTSHPALRINQTGSNDLLELQQSSAGVVTVSSTGATTFKNSTNSTTALQVQNASAATLLNVDTSTTPNLVTNGDFEGGGVTGWTAKGSTTRSQVTTQQWQGNSSLQAATTTAANDGVQYNFTFTNTQQYTLSFYAKVASGSITDVNVGRQDNGSTDTDCLTGQTFTTSWTYFSCSFTAGAQSGTPNFYIKKTGSSAETFFIDGVQLKTGNTTSAFNAGGAVQIGSVVNSPLAIQNKSDSTNAFQVQNVAGGQLLNVDTVNGFVQIQAPNSTPATSAGVAKLVINSNWTDTSGDEAQIVFGEAAQFNSSSGKLYYTGVDNMVRLGGLNSSVTTDVLTFRRDGANVTLQNSAAGNLVIQNNFATGSINLTPSGSSSSGVLVNPTNNSLLGFLIQDTSGNRALDFDNINNRLGINLTSSSTPSAEFEIHRQDYTTRGNNIKLSTANGNDWYIGQSASATYATGNNLTFKSDGTSNNVLTLNSQNGSALFQDSTDNTTAFQVQDAAGVSLLTTDTYNQIINTGGGVLTAPSGGGTTGTWGTSTALGTGCGAAVYGAASVAYNGFIYIIGGSTSGTTATATTCYATLNAGTGAVGTWTAAGNNPGTSLYNATANVYNGYIYLIGGTNGTTDQTTVYYSKINANGTLGTWNTTTSISSIYASGIQLATSVISNGYLYVLGGSSAGTLKNNVSYAKINSDGTLGSWNSTATLVAALAGASTVVNNGYIYEIGGNTSGNTCAGTNTTVIRYAPLYSDGTIGTWNATTSLSNGRFGAAGIAWGGYVYDLEGNVAGTGCSPSGVPNQALPANSNGTLGAQTSPTSPGTSLFQAPAVTYNGYVYILGGTTDGGTTVSSAVQFATINGNQGTSTSATNVVVNGATTTGNLNVVGMLQASSDVLFKNSATSVWLFNVITSTNTINIGATGTTAAASTVNIANTTGNATQTINIGATNSASNAVLIQGGTGGSAITLQAGNAGTITIGSQTASTANTIVIGASGSTTNADNVSIDNTSGTNAGTITLGGSGTATGNITIGQSTGSQTVQIGIGAPATGATQTIKVGTTVSTTSGLTSITIGGTSTTTNGATAVSILAGNHSGTTVANGSRAATDTDSTGVKVSLGDMTSTNAVCTGSTLGTGTAPTSGTAYELVDCSGTPVPDYAEMYPTDGTSTYGDIMMLGAQSVQEYATDGYGNILYNAPKRTVTQLVKGNQSYATNVVGVVSNNYGDFSSTGHNVIDPSNNPMPIALNGRVPVNISSSSAPIAVGDYITVSSSDPGKGIKATQAGEVIGKALEAWTPGSGQTQIMVFVEQGYYAGPSADSYVQNGGDANLANLNVAGNTTLASLGVAGATNLNSLNVSGPTTLASLSVTGDANIGGNLTVTGSVAIGGSLTVTGVLSVADITINGHIITAGGQPTSQPQVAAGGSATVSVNGTDTTGTITITTGSNPTAGDLAKILFSKTYGQAPHIVLSPSNDKAAGLRFFKGGTSATDFMFDALDTPQANTTYTFDYFIAQ